MAEAQHYVGGEASEKLRDTKTTLIDRLFLASLVLGPAASFSIVYLFHLVLALKLAQSLGRVVALSKWRIPRALRGDAAFGCVFIAWYSASVFWAENTSYAVRYSIYVFLAAFAVAYVVRICRTTSNLRTVLRFVGIIISIQIFLAILEGAGFIRLPFSPYSQYREYFGREAVDMSRFSDNVVRELKSSPTGFLGNPNNLSAFLVLILPFYLLSKNWLIRVSGAFSVLYIVYMAGARAALIAYCLVVVASIVFFARGVIRWVTIAVLCLTCILGAIFFDAMKTSEHPLVAEMRGVGMAVVDMVAGLIGQESLERGSTGTRVLLIQNGLDALRNSYGLGVGAGGSRAVQESASIERLGEIGSMHNFWIELLVDGGVVFMGIFVIWYWSLLYRLWRVYKQSNNAVLRYFAKALFIGLLGFVAGAIGPSSVIYMLPLWMIVGIALATIWLESKQRAGATSGIQNSQTSPKFAADTEARS